MKEEKVYYKKLDYIRIFSCMMVLLYHLNIIKGGFLTVCTFFALSGYLSTISFLSKNNFSLKKYYLNRLKKIYIPLLLVVSITVIYSSITNINWLNLKKESISVLLGYNNFWQLSANLDYFTRHVSSPFIHFWYISILMQLELLFPLIYLILNKLSKKINKNISIIIIFILSIISTIYFIYMSKQKDMMNVYYNTLTRCFSYIYGILLGIIHKQYHFKVANALKKYSNLIFYIYTIILLIMCLLISSQIKEYSIFMILTTIISCRLIEYGIMNINDKKNKIIDILSKISYELYLVQYPVIFFLTNLKIASSIKNIIIIIITFIISYIIHKALTKSKNNNYNIIKKISVIVIIIIGIFVIAISKDNTKEMKQLEEKLNQNLKIINEKNNMHKEKSKEEEEAWNKKLESIENEEEKTKEIVSNLEVVGIGDSVLLGTINEFYNQFPNGYFDGKVSRTIYGAEDLLNELKSKGKLKDIVILSLATNGDYSIKRNNELMEILKDKEIYWINAVGADDPTFNEKFKEYAKDYSNIHIVEWDIASKNHPEYFYADGIHIRESYAKYYVDCVYDAIYQDYIKDYRSQTEKIKKEREEKKKEKIVFYGNDTLTQIYQNIEKKYNNSSFYSKKYNLKKLSNEIKQRNEDNTLEYRIVLLFDEKTNISKEDYLKLIESGEGHEFYIVNLSKQQLKINKENVKAINLYNEMKKDKDYYLGDNMHLSNKGIKYLSNKIYNEIEKK